MPLGKPISLVSSHPGILPVSETRKAFVSPRSLSTIYQEQKNSRSRLKKVRRKLCGSFTTVVVLCGSDTARGKQILFSRNLHSLFYEGCCCCHSLEYVVDSRLKSF
ncbi:hypothetical protein CEXT_344271 [Caerostris extrusa]|uniref:Uncharacterized protein n=1 Tax=Caerostris extrusa TaxID=172846 RepID=A0AAV4TZI9_CAEEX|nr:hypothetical protein CEXT_344271 [Caerostris extrusa]